MKIAISITGRESSSTIDSRFGRALFFKIVETESGEESVFDNSTSTEASHGAGMQTAQALARQDVSAVVTGQVGPKAMNVLKAAKIRVFSTNSTRVEDALEEFRSGNMQELS
ncbi:MAG: NifB/NifX family molybdenum-iron cluster-binding protein [Opitutales bacterium]|nr:NifB/NifX family molybdenum-iron cluster-binding protein [Opitutales bacterium]